MAQPFEPAHILIVEDDHAVSSLVAAVLRADGREVQSVPSAQQALDVARDAQPRVVLLDLSLPDSQDLNLFHRMRAMAPRDRIVIMTAYDNLDLVIGATRAGAFDFITKGVDLVERVRVTVRNAIESLAHESQVNALGHTLAVNERFGRLVSQSRQMEEVRQSIDKLAQSKVNVLIHGASGTGKEVVARTIHESGARAAGPFIAVNCAGIPDTLLESELFGYERGAFTGAIGRKIGKFEAAHHGTLFLDEVGEMSLPLQAKLLRVLQDGRFERLGGNTVVQPDARILTATNRDLQAMVRAGLFREDLYYRIAVFTLFVPPLCERKGDIALLTQRFVSQVARDEHKSIAHVSPEVLRLFELHDWPGNVRQLQNIIARSALQCDTDTLSLRDLPHAFVAELQALRCDEPTQSLLSEPTQPSSALPTQLRSGTAEERLDLALQLCFPSAELLPTAEELEAAGIRLAMRRLRSNLQLTAKRLEISRATLYRRMEALHLRGPDVQPEKPEPPPIH